MNNAIRTIYCPGVLSDRRNVLLFKSFKNKGKKKMPVIRLFDNVSSSIGAYAGDY